MLLLSYLETISDDLTAVGHQVGELVDSLCTTLFQHEAYRTQHELTLTVLKVVSLLSFPSLTNEINDFDAPQIVQKFTKNQKGLELIPFILKALEVHIIEIVRSLELEASVPSQATSLPFTSLPKRCVALVVDLFVPLLPYKTVRDIISTHKLVERILTVIFQRSRYVLYSLALDLVKAAVVCGYAHKLITAR